MKDISSSNIYERVNKMNDRVLIAKTKKGRIRAYSFPLMEEDEIIEIKIHKADEQDIVEEWKLVEC